MQIHKDIKNDMKFLAKSEIRLKILSELNKEPKSVTNLVKETKITYSSVSNNISVYVYITSIIYIFIKKEWECSLIEHSYAPTHS